jgi:hypothetical protein
MTTTNYQFHLDSERPEEAKALHLLNEWQRNGWSVQKTLVAALLALAEQDTYAFSRQALENLQAEAQQTLREARQVLAQAQQGFAQPNAPTPPSPPVAKAGEPISADLVKGLSHNVKRGFSLD